MKSQLTQWLVILAVTSAVACGGNARSSTAIEATITASVVATLQASPTATPLPTSTAATPAYAVFDPTQVPTATAVPTPTPVQIDAPRPSSKLSGTLNVAVKNLDRYSGSPKWSGNPAILLNNAAPVTETLGMASFSSSEVLPMLAESWDISADGKVWTFHIRKGVQFHKGFGEMTAEDVSFSFGQVANNRDHPRQDLVRRILFADGASQTMPDPFTWVVDTGVTFFDDILFLELLTTPRSGSVWVVSKKQFDQTAKEDSSPDGEANRNTAATGPWEINDWRAGEFWKMDAVEDHWRQTPVFAQLIEWDIPGMPSRLAGLKVGNLDTFEMQPDNMADSIAIVESVDGAQLMRIPHGSQLGLNFYGATHLNAKDSNEPWPNYDPDLAWVSANADENSESWKNAVKVRKALSISIDRQAIIDEFLLGFGHSNTMQGWGGPNEARYDDDMVWDYDPVKAKALLVEAGYPDGFSIILRPEHTGQGIYIASCEAIGRYWEDIGVDVVLGWVPYGSFLVSTGERIYQGASCHLESIRTVPTQGFAGFTNASLFSLGAEHEFLEEYIGKAQRATSRADREAAENALARWNFDNVFAMTGLYVDDNLWAVGPNISPWDEFVKQGDLGQMNGFEYIKPR